METQFKQYTQPKWVAVSLNYKPLDNSQRIYDAVEDGILKRLDVRHSTELDTHSGVYKYWTEWLVQLAPNK